MARRKTRRNPNLTDDLLTLGIVGGGAYLAYRWWQGRQTGVGSNGLPVISTNPNSVYLTNPYTNPASGGSYSVNPNANT